MDTTTVRTLRPNELPRAADVLTRALFEDPFFTAMLPDPDRRRAPLRRQMSGAIRYALHHGLVETTPHLGAVAVWLPPGRTHITVRTMLAAGPATVWEMMSLPPDAMRRAIPFREPMEDLHRRSAPDPHWYLWILGVDPRYQRQGLGTSLVRHRMAAANATPVYLETARRDNVAYYERLGFEPVAIAEVPQMAVTFWGMLSPARQPTSN